MPLTGTHTILWMRDKDKLWKFAEVYWGSCQTPTAKYFCENS